MCSDSLKRWGTKLWSLCVPAPIPLLAMNACILNQAGRIKEPYTFYPYKVNIWSWKTTPPVPGSFKVQHLEDNLWIFIRNILTIQQGWGLLLGLCIHKHLPPSHTHKHTIVWSAKVLIYDHLPKWISTYSTHPSYPVYKHFSTSARTLTE